MPKLELKKIDEYETVFFNVVPESMFLIKKGAEESIPITIIPDSMQDWKNRLLKRKD